MLGMSGLSAADFARAHSPLRGLSLHAPLPLTRFSVRSVLLSGRSTHMLMVAIYSLCYADTLVRRIVVNICSETVGCRQFR